MPTWGEILNERKALMAARRAPDDFLRDKYLAALAKETGRDTILYATKWTQPLMQGVSPHAIQITHEDLQAMMEAVHGLTGPNLDLILHSPGGSPEAAESIVLYLRSKFKHVRVIVPHAAMSAATMISCSANEIMMGNHSFLGPIDPQFILMTPLGQRSVPADAVRDQFAMAIEKCKDPKNATAWFPMLAMYGPDVLVQCENATRLSKGLVTKWLQTYMFAGVKGGQNRARAIANWLGNHKKFNSHGRHICRDELLAHKLNVLPLEKDQKTQDLVLSVFHAISQTFDNTGCLKVVANHLGKCFQKAVNLQPQQGMPMPFGPMQRAPFIPIPGIPVNPPVAPGPTPAPVQPKPPEQLIQPDTTPPGAGAAPSQPVQPSSPDPEPAA